MKILLYLRQYDAPDSLMGQLHVGPVPNLPQQGDLIDFEGIAYQVINRRFFCKTTYGSYDVGEVHIKLMKL